jgi:alpha-L-fucosidase 2
MKKILFLIPVLAIFFSCRETVRVACVGDSITEGACIANEATNSYPSQLQNILGSRYIVLNAGRGWATVNKKGDVPYWTRNEFHNVFAFKPNIVVIKLGTNDSKPNNWNAVEFQKSLQALIDTFKTMPSPPDLLLCLPSKAYAQNSDIRDTVIVSGIIPCIQKVASENKIQVVDLHTALSNKKELFPDGIHPNEAGYRIIAEEVAKEVVRIGFYEVKK